MCQPGPLLVGLVRGPRKADEADTRAFAAELQHVVAAGCDRVLVDLSGGERLTTPGMNALLETRQQLLAREGAVVLVLSDGLRRTFELLGLDRRFQLASDPNRATDLLGLTSRAGSAGDATRRAA